MPIDWTDSCLSIEQREILRKTLLKFSDIFVGSSKAPGRTNLIEFNIDTGDSPPIRSAPYRTSKAEGDVMEAEINQYLELGLIRPSKSPWASPVLMIRKPDGGIRFCIDYRKLNSVTIKDSYPMPRIDDLLDVLGRAKLFSTMDIASGYWNVPMRPDSVAKTAFTCKYGLYEWLVMPFGLCNAVPCFERLMETILIDEKWRICLVYLDDCIVYSEDFGSHLVRLTQVLTKFRDAGFKLKMSKCKWGRSSVAFLGHIVTPAGILPNPEKIKSVLRIGDLKDVSEVRAFLGLAGYFRRFIRDYAKISSPLTALLTADPFVWSPACSEAVDTLKKRLVSPPLLAHPDFDEPFSIWVDASQLAVGAVLLQSQHGQTRVIAYASQALTKAQRKWLGKDYVTKESGISEIECWGIVWATRKFRPYIDRRHFDLYTDHGALKWLFNNGKRSGNHKLSRWAMELQGLDYTVHHRAGELNGCADGLSRLITSPVITRGMLTSRVPLRPDDTSESPLRHDDTSASLLQPEGTSDASLPRSTDFSGHMDSSPGRRGKKSTSSPDATSRSTSPSLRSSRPTTPPAATSRSTSPGSPTSSARRSPSTSRTSTSAPFELFDGRGRPSPRLYNEQDRDPWIVAIKAYLDTGALPLDPQLLQLVSANQHHFLLRQGVVCRYVTVKTPLRNPELLIVPVIPHSMVLEVLEANHTSPLAGHQGYYKTRERIRRTAYWPDWQADCKEYVAKCLDCNRSKGGRPWKQGPMQRMPVYSLRGPFGLMVVDALGPLPTSDGGNKYILVFADYFTRWVEAFAVPDLTTSTFTRVFIDEVLCRFGIPDRLLTDRGTNFVSELASSMYATLGIDKLAGSAYHPQTQGLVERFNHSLVQMLKVYVNDHQTDWDTYLPRVLFAYRTSHHETLGDSPYFCLFGRDPTLPLDLAFLNVDPVWKSDDLPQYKRRLAASWQTTRSLVEKQLISGQNKSARAKSAQKRVEFADQDSVWVYKYFSKTSHPSDTRTKKLAKLWHGPYRVERRLGPNTYKIAIPTHPDKSVTVNVDRLKKFRGYFSRPFNDDIPSTSDDAQLSLDDLPSSSFVERIDFPDNDVAYTNVSSPIFRILDTRRRPHTREPDYLVEHVDGSKYWTSASRLAAYRSYIDAFHDTRRMEQGLPPLRRSPRFRDLDVAPTSRFDF